MSMKLQPPLFLGQLMERAHTHCVPHRIMVLIQPHWPKHGNLFGCSQLAYQMGLQDQAAHNITKLESSEDLPILEINLWSTVSTHWCENCNWTLKILTNHNLIITECCRKCSVKCCPVNDSSQDSRIAYKKIRIQNFRKLGACE